LAVAGILPAVVRRRSADVTGRETSHDAFTATPHPGPPAAQLLAQDRRGLRPPRRPLRQALRPLPRAPRARAGPRVPATPAGAEGALEPLQPGRGRPALPLLGDPASARADPDAALRQEAEDGALRAQPGRGAPAVRRGGRPGLPRAAADHLR